MVKNYAKHCSEAVCTLLLRASGAVKAVACSSEMRLVQHFSKALILL